MADKKPDPENQPQPEAMRLKTLAEQTYIAGNLKSALKYAKRAHRLQPSLDGVEELHTALEILRTSAIPISPTLTDDTASTTPAPPDYYNILQIERFAHINTIKKQYRKLALALHPDKNPFIASEEAFKYVGEGFSVLSDRIRRKEYDMKLRIAMQNEAEAAAAGGVGDEVEQMSTFWTACSTCRLLNKFERKYLGHILVCPSCKKSFEAVEVVEENTGATRVEEEENTGTERVEEGKNKVEVEAGVDVRSSERVKAKRMGKMSSVGEILERSRGKIVELKGKKVKKDLENVGKKRGLRTRDDGGLGVIEGPRGKRVGLELKNVAKKKRVGRSAGGLVDSSMSLRSGRNKDNFIGVEVVKGTRTGAKRLKVVEEEMMTLAEMQLFVKKTVSEAKLKGKEQGKDKKEMEDNKKGKGMEKEEGQVNERDIQNENIEEEEEDESEKEKEMEDEDESEKEKRKMGVRKVMETEKRERKGASDDETLASMLRKAFRSDGDLSMEKGKRSGQSNFQIVPMMEKEKEADEEGQVNEKDIQNENIEEEEEEESEKEMEMEEEEETTMNREKKEKQKINKKKLIMEKEKEEDREGQVNEKDIQNENIEEEESEKEMEMEMEMEEEEETTMDREEKEKQKINRKKRKMGLRKVMETEKRERKGVSNDETMAIMVRNGDLSMEKCNRSRQSNLHFVPMNDSDFYDFDKDRAERSFKKGQVWAIYDSEDGMPRHYGLIDDVISVDPFEVRLSWLEYESSGDHQLISRERMGIYVSCGRFKVSEKATVKSVKMFSHLADCERAAREVYRIYPKKGSVWAIYNEHALHSDRNNETTHEKHDYDIVVFLTSYSDIHSLSMAYLEKVDGWKTIFKRTEIGPHAIRFLGKDEFKLLSHQIPGKKLSGEEAPGLPKYCWELDPASLPPNTLTNGWTDTNALESIP